MEQVAPQTQSLDSSDQRLALRSRKLTPGASRLPRLPEQPQPPKVQEAARGQIETRLGNVRQRVWNHKFLPDNPDAYEDFGEVCEDLDWIVGRIWKTGMPGRYAQQLLIVAGLINDEMQAFEPEPEPTFLLLQKLDHVFASILIGRDFVTRIPLPGLDNGSNKVLNQTEKVRLQAIANGTRNIVAVHMDLEDDVETVLNAERDEQTFVESDGGLGPRRTWDSPESPPGLADDDDDDDDDNDDENDDDQDDSNDDDDNDNEHDVADNRWMGDAEKDSAAASRKRKRTDTNTAPAARSSNQASQGQTTQPNTNFGRMGTPDKRHTWTNTPPNDPPQTSPRSPIADGTGNSKGQFHFQEEDFSSDSDEDPVVLNTSGPSVVLSAPKADAPSSPLKASTHGAKSPSGEMFTPAQTSATVGGKGSGTALATGSGAALATGDPDDEEDEDIVMNVAKIYDLTLWELHTPLKFEYPPRPPQPEETLASHLRDQQLPDDRPPVDL